jgi:hypothetical protein
MRFKVAGKQTLLSTKVNTTSWSLSCAIHILYQIVINDELAFRYTATGPTSQYDREITFSQVLAIIIDHFTRETKNFEWKDKPFVFEQA